MSVSADNNKEYNKISKYKYKIKEYNKIRKFKYKIKEYNKIRKYKDMEIDIEKM